MSKNRLDLDFSLKTQQERKDFIDAYLDSIPFTPTPDELNTISSYILWGKNSNGEAAAEDGIELESKWTPNKTESLDALIESPTFTEASIRPLTQTPLKQTREVFSRTQARQKAPAHILRLLEDLWTQIDSTELILNYYELAHGRRKNAPRQELLDRFNDADLGRFREKGESISSFTYLKLKRELVDLRRDQYMYKDEYAPTPMRIKNFVYTPDMAPTFGTEITILPIGLPSDNIQLYYKIFNPNRYPIPSDFTQSELSALSKFLWMPREPSQFTFDFRDTKHLYEMYGMWNEIVEEAKEAPLMSNLGVFVRAASMYRTLAALDPMLDKILELKIRHTSNIRIAEIINAEFGRKYRDNYISTLYCQKCLKKIAEAAAMHREVLENCFFPENFKKCRDCGQTLLLNEENFMKRHRSFDGFSPRCKKCEKQRRK